MTKNVVKLHPASSTRASQSGTYEASASRSSQLDLALTAPVYVDSTGEEAMAKGSTSMSAAALDSLSDTPVSLGLAEDVRRIMRDAPPPSSMSSDDYLQYVKSKLREPRFGAYKDMVLIAETPEISFQLKLLQDANTVRKTEESGEAPNYTKPAAQYSKPLQSPDTKQVVKFIYWKQDEYAAPWLLTSCALFKPDIDKKRGRKHLERERLATWASGSYIEYTGPELVQGDLDVWMELASIARSQYSDFELFEKPFESIDSMQNVPALRIRCSTNTILKGLGKNSSGNNHRWFRNAVSRLKSANMELFSKGETGHYGREIGGALILFSSRETEIITRKDGSQDQRDGDHLLWLNLPVLRLYLRGFSRVKKELRSGLNSTGKWLQLFVKQHKRGKNPVRIGEELLQEKMGLRQSHARNFRRAISQCMDQLAKQKEVTTSLKAKRNRKGEKVKNWWYVYQDKETGQNKYQLVFFPAASKDEDVSE